MSPTKNNYHTAETSRKNNGNNDADDLKAGPAKPGKSKTRKTKKTEKTENTNEEITSENKIKSYKEGNRDDSIIEDDNADYDDIENDYSAKKYPDEN